ncbi:undecaprenyl-diphosphatase [Paenibacillus sp. VCA1]|uniref:undecaprenyl-diphosphatase n=1 Tax=Paenibacillus sp. VCA1 TaxID=3039148 RepID=UPI0028711667|nr:undecaprenyl-diphosphatase [Paenibacillus sp. VCA1]MDR9857118.1 undecaprenyl-diphosphatase [Paenibacillus sp. VCA1]
MSISDIDYRLFQAINEGAKSASFLNPVMRFLAEDAFYLFFAGLLVYWFLRNENNRKMVVTSVISVCCGLAVSWLLGHLFYRDRPFVSHTVIQLIQHPANASFPSDHAIGAFAIAASFALYRKKEGIAWLVLAALIAFSRVWTGVHYPTDILGGALIGVAVSGVVYMLVNRSGLVSKWVAASLRFYETYEMKIWPGRSEKETRMSSHRE